jgi:hypothetical protein
MAYGLKAIEPMTLGKTVRDVTPCYVTDGLMTFYLLLPSFQLLKPLIDLK